MSDFQDEQGLGELPSDLSLSEKTAYILPSIPSADISPAQPQNEVTGLNIPNSGNDLVKFVYDTRPMFGVDLNAYSDLTAIPGSIKYTVPDGKILIVRSFNYMAVNIGGNVVTPQPVGLTISIDGVVYDGFIPDLSGIAGIAPLSPQLNVDCFIIVDSNQTIAFNFVSQNANDISFHLRGNLLLSNGTPAYMQAAGAK